MPRRQRGWVCISGDEYTKNHGHESKLADLLFAWKIENDNRLSCVLELKSGNFSVTGVVGQLQQAAHLVDQFLRGTAVDFLPVLVHGAVNVVTLRRLEVQNVVFRGTRIKIRRMRCGGKVEDLNWSLAIRR
jgi:hypothetical protein